MARTGWQEPANRDFASGNFLRHIPHRFCGLPGNRPLQPHLRKCEASPGVRARSGQADAGLSGRADQDPASGRHRPDAGEQNKRPRHTIYGTDAGAVRNGAGERWIRATDGDLTMNGAETQMATPGETQPASSGHVFPMRVFPMRVSPVRELPVKPLAILSFQGLAAARAGAAR
jgi:hypothetical protein